MDVAQVARRVHLQVHAARLVHLRSLPHSHLYDALGLSRLGGCSHGGMASDREGYSLDWLVTGAGVDWTRLGFRAGWWLAMLAAVAVCLGGVMKRDRDPAMK